MFDTITNNNELGSITHITLIRKYKLIQYDELKISVINLRISNR